MSLYFKICKLFGRCWKKWCHNWQYGTNRRVCVDCGVKEVVVAELWLDGDLNPIKEWKRIK